MGLGVGLGSLVEFEYFHLYWEGDLAIGSPITPLYTTPPPPLSFPP